MTSSDKIKSRKRVAADDQWMQLTLSERQRKAFELQVSCDVTFIVGDEMKTIKAHKAILSLGSPVLAAQFYGGLADGDTITITDIEYDVFINVLMYLYSDEIELNQQNAMANLYAAKKYQIEAIEKSSIEFVMHNLAKSKVLEILSDANFFDATELVEACLMVIDANAELLSGEQFITISPQVLHLIVTRDSLNISEVDLYLAMVKWAKKRCQINKKNVNDAANLREALGVDLYAIRFPLMTNQKFTDHVSAINFLFNNRYN